MKLNNFLILIIIILFNAEVLSASSVTLISYYSTRLYSEIREGLSPIKGSSINYEIKAGTPMRLITEILSDSPLTGDMLKVEVLQGIHKGKKGYIMEEFVYPVSDRKQKIYAYPKKNIIIRDRVIHRNSRLIYESHSITAGTFALLFKEESSNISVILGDLSQIRYYTGIEDENLYRLNNNERIIRVIDASTLLPVKNAGDYPFLSNEDGYIYIDIPEKEGLLISKKSYHSKPYKITRNFNSAYILPEFNFPYKITGLSSLVFPFISDKELSVKEGIIMKNQSLPDTFITGSDIIHYSFDYELVNITPAPVTDTIGKSDGVFFSINPLEKTAGREVRITNNNREFSQAYMISENGSYVKLSEEVSIRPGVYQIYYENCKGLDTASSITASIRADGDISDIIKNSRGFRTENKKVRYDLFRDGLFKLTHYKSNKNTFPAEITGNEIFLSIKNGVFEITPEKYSMKLIPVENNNKIMLHLRSAENYTPLLSFPDIIFDIEFSLLADIIVIDITEIEVKRRVRNSIEIPDLIKEIMSLMPIRLFLEEKL